MIVQGIHLTFQGVFMIKLMFSTLLISISIFSQINIRGTVVNANGDRMMGAVVNFKKFGLTAVTNMNGEFNIVGTGIVPTNKSAKIALTSINKILNIKNFNRNIFVYNISGKKILNFNKLGKGVYLINSISPNAKIDIDAVAYSSSYELTVSKEWYDTSRIEIPSLVFHSILIKMQPIAGTVTDIDGNVYPAVKIGNQVWTMENLKTIHYNDGTPIPKMTDSTEGMCWYDNDMQTYKRNGAFYSFGIVFPLNPKKIAPSGWRVPSSKDWDTLQNYLIANGYNWDGTRTGNKTAQSLASKNSWRTGVGGGLGAITANSEKNNRSGFTAIASGLCWKSSNGGIKFSNLGYSGSFGSSEGYGRGLYCQSENLLGADRAEGGKIIRLIKN
jgi:uncharacterized protein (TIGR02145 family)